MSAEADQQTHTTLWVSKDLAGRLEEMKPYDSLTWDEWLAELADIYEENQR
ncbi:hypothetical protein NDI54_05805 [Haloarcula sp. S1AR25-5A]|uniref:Uncharacterized protein n=1 Tax=Haloarcula terrestris TaxID=2950533 RepID=A0AAE4EVJ5_9EURY|nr:hypothetical protein [Haloarcula terrestris]MDS0220868.1 hypothetical protein [Haloarcula terrestris]